MKPGKYEYLTTFDGLRLRCASWRADSTPCRGTVVLLGGRTEFLEKYHETIEDLLERGFDVFGLDWRGQGLSDRLLTDASKGHVETYTHYLRDFELFIERIVLPQYHRPLIIMAHSMGANIVLHSLKGLNNTFDRGVLLSPMVDVLTTPMPYGWAKRICRWLVNRGKGDVKVPSLQHNDSYRRPFRNNRMTHDPGRFARVQEMLKRDPRLAVTSVTYGWLAATFTAVEGLKKPGFISTVNIPLLWAVAGGDRVVSNPHTHRLAGQLPDSQLVTIDGAFHEILQEQDGMRNQFWRAFDGFVRS